MMKRFWHWCWNEGGVILILALVASTLILINAVIAYPQTTDFDKRNAIVQECLKSEQYTRDECIVLAGGNK